MAECLCISFLNDLDPSFLYFVFCVSYLYSENTVTFLSKKFIDRWWGRESGIFFFFVIMYDYGKTSISRCFSQTIPFLPFPQKTVFTVDPIKVPQTRGKDESALVQELTGEAQMLHESYRSRTSLMCFFSSLPRTQSTII